MIFFGCLFQPMYVSLCVFICFLVTMASKDLSQVGEVKDMATSNTHFGLELLRHCRAATPKQNIIFAPYSITTALAMTSVGAGGNTADEMKKVLKWESGKTPFTGFGSYLPLLKEAADSNASGYSLLAAQRIYVGKQLALKLDFSTKTKEHFASETSKADFVGNPDEERISINSWVTEKTKGKISDLLPAGSVNPLTVMVLVQALYFKGNWKHKFDPKKTEEADFISPMGKVRVQMMKQQRKFNFYSSEELLCTAVELPYASNSTDSDDYDLSMLILLPDANDGLEKLEASITNDALQKIKSYMYPVKVNLQLPRFSAESSISLKDILAKMGMSLAFSDKADFSGMVTGPGADQLYISEVFHKAVIEVNEEGTEAAAATGVVMMARSLPRIENFIADHPFLYFIIDKRADVVLFSGHFVQPPSEGFQQQKQEL